MYPKILKVVDREIATRFDQNRRTHQVMDDADALLTVYRMSIFPSFLVLFPFLLCTLLLLSNLCPFLSSFFLRTFSALNWQKERERERSSKRSW